MEFIDQKHTFTRHQTKMKIRSREDLKTYVLRRLGQPVIRVNVEEHQLQDAIDDALDYFQTFSAEAQQTFFFKHIFTEKNITDKYIVLDESTINVTKAFPTDSPFVPNWMSPEYKNFIRELKDMQAGSLESYFITERHISLLNFMLVKTNFSFNYNEITRKLVLHTDWGFFKPGKSFIILETTQKTNPDDFPALWDSYWVKELCYYNVLKRWGNNLKKYANVPLPGGITLNATEMIDESTNAIATLQQQLRDMTDALPFFQMA